MTLAAIAATDEVWGELEKEWDKTLQEHTPKGSYIHMKEVYRLEKAFDKNLGWNHDNAFGLVNKCLVYMSHLPKDKLRVFYCSVDLLAWQKLRAETYQMPDPIALCNTYCSEFVLTWYGFVYPSRSTLINPETDSVRYFFDRNDRNMWRRYLKPRCNHAARIQDGRRRKNPRVNSKRTQANVHDSCSHQGFPFGDFPVRQAPGCDQFGESDAGRGIA